MEQLLHFESELRHSSVVSATTCIFVHLPGCNPLYSFELPYAASAQLLCSAQDEAMCVQMAEGATWGATTALEDPAGIRKRD